MGVWSCMWIFLVSQCSVVDFAVCGHIPYLSLNPNRLLKFLHVWWHVSGPYMFCKAVLVFPSSLWTWKKQRRKVYLEGRVEEFVIFPVSLYYESLDNEGSVTPQYDSLPAYDLGPSFFDPIF